MQHVMCEERGYCHIGLVGSDSSIMFQQICHQRAEPVKRWFEGKPHGAACALKDGIRSRGGKSRGCPVESSDTYRDPQMR